MADDQVVKESITVFDVSFKPDVNTVYLEMDAIISGRVAVCEYKGCFFLCKRFADKYLVMLELTEQETVALVSLLDTKLNEKEI